MSEINQIDKKIPETKNGNIICLHIRMQNLIKNLD